MVESSAPDARPSPLPDGPPSGLPDEAQNDGPPSLRGTIIGATVCLFFAALCFVGVLGFGHTAIEGWHLEHTAIRGLVTHVGACEDNGDLDIECPARFTSLDGRMVDRPITLNTWRSDPAEPVPARLAGPGYTHVWADDATQQPSTRGGLIGLVGFSAFTAFWLAPAVWLINTYRHGRGSRGGPPPG
jgi:hypothetical protein